MSKKYSEYNFTKIDGKNGQSNQSDQSDQSDQSNQQKFSEIINSPSESSFKSKMYNMTGVGLGLGLTVGVGLGTFILFRYKTSKSNEWLVRTGLGIKDIEIGKKFVKWPFQNIDCIDMTPQTYKFSVYAMSKEKMEFNFPAAFTIGPKNSQESLINYARYLITQENLQLQNMILPIIEGETRALSANLQIEEIFSGRSEFKNEIVTNVQEQLDKLGVEIINANIEKLEDSANSNYFVSLSKKINSEAENRAKVEVAEQEKIGQIGEFERSAETRQKLSIIEAETKLIENQKEQEIVKSDTELEKFKQEQILIKERARIETSNKKLLINLEFEKEVEIKRNSMEVEKKRAEGLSATQVNAEIAEQQAIGEAKSQKILADANYYKMQREADGIKAIYEAKSEGLSKMIGTFNNNPSAFLAYNMMDKNIYQELAKSNADAIKGLNPKITVWTNDPSNSMDPVKNLGKSIIPMMDIIENQTGYKLPDWILTKNNNQTDQSDYPNQSNQSSQPSQPNQSNQTNQINQINKLVSNPNTNPNPIKKFR